MPMNPAVSQITTPNWDNNTWLSSPEYIAYAVKVLTDCLNLNTTGRVLDIGCGRGHIAMELASTNHLSIPVDAIDLADLGQQNLDASKVRFSRCNALEYLQNKPDDHYDGIILKQMFHLIPEEDRGPLLSQIYRCLKKGGRALILQMPEQSAMPMFAKVKQIFRRELLPLNTVMSSARQAGFKTDVSAFSFPVTLDKKAYIGLLEKRFMSVLRELTDAQIRDGIAEFNTNYPQDVLVFSDDLDVVHLIR